MNDKFYIKKIIRDDAETLIFDDNEIYLAEKNNLLIRPDPNTTAVEYTGVDGGEMIKQRNTIYQQEIVGLIIPRTTDYWTLTQTLSSFFKINHTYKIVYIRKDGTMFAASNAWISNGLQIPPEPRETYSEWSVEFAIGNTAWTEYSEDASGKEIYSNTITLPLISANAGGEIWDSVGLVSDNVGEEWEKGAGGAQTVNIQSTQAIYPIWTVVGPCTNPTISNNTTDTLASFEGTVAAGQTLTVDFAESVAYLNTALVTRYIDGYISLAPGENTVWFNSDGGATESSTISWNNIVN